MTKRHISLKDLAKELNVSISTVSRALKDHPDISEEVRKKVKLLAEKLNYSPNPLAMGLLKQKTRMIGIIVPDLVTHFYSSIIAGIESSAKENGYFIVIASSNESAEKEKEAIENLLKARVEGLIVCLSQETSDMTVFNRLLQREFPLVFFDRVALNGKVPAVTADNVLAAEKIVQHFHEQGYRRIAFIGGPEDLNISKERLSGYKQGLTNCGLPIRQEYIEKCELNPDSARQAMHRLLNLPELPDAVFGINDTVAFALMKEIKEAGLSIPGDIGVIGFTDEFHSTVVDPPLTSITHPTFEMGRMAGQLFFEQVAEKVTPHTVVMETQLVIRESSSRIGQ
ncbi:LacI family DNA-binding transcriptional regulator [Mangrovibacterium sp.]|uniref:LacI family DNA-binding transcriptional regulator n=1 Tax=Mangrovibacterium sp. TaxID=1961364 RepID=UPI00356199E8